MAFLIPKPKTPAHTSQAKLAGIHVISATIGAVLNVLLGQRRLSQSLIYYSDFVAIPHVQQSPAGGGGKGLGGGGGSNQPSTTYTYQAATIGALCSGPVGGIVNVWDTKGRFQQTSTTEGFTIPGGGGTHQVINHGIYKVDQGVGFALAYSQGVNDFGSPGAITLSGTYQVPMLAGSVAAPGVYAVNPATGTYTFHAADAGKAVSITYSYNLLQLNNTETAQIPGSPYQVLVDDSADFLQDTSVVFYPSATALQKVGSGPTAGQYSVAAGLYTFAAADTLKQVQISYVTNTQNQQSDAQTALNLTLLNGAKGQPVWSYLTSRHPEAAIGYTEMAVVASSAMALGSNGEIPNYSLEIAGPYQYGAGIVDCCPADVIGALLADPFFGIGFPVSCFGDWTQARNFWVANNFFISPLYTSQSAVASMISPILESGMTAAFWSEGQMKLAPYGDTSAAGNGLIYVPNTQPVVDLDDTCIIGVVNTTRSPWQDAYNKVQISWSNRLNGYNPEPTTEQDDAAIQTQGGVRAESPQNWDFICTLAAAQFAANLRVKRSVNIRSAYTAKLKSKYSFLEPMDLVTLTVAELGWVKKPVRVTKTVDNPAGPLDVTFEDFPWGTAQPTLYAKQTGLGFKPNAGQADPGNTSALVFEATNRLSMQKGNVLYIFVSGQTPDWGGCYILASFDGVKYDDVNGGNPITTPARLGSLVGSLAAGTVDPDLSSFQVKMSSAGAVLPAMSAANFAQFVSMCVLINRTTNTPFELFAYKNATLVGKDTFQLDTLHRGLYGTANAAHSAGESFARLDQASFMYQYDPSFYGQTIFFKFPSFNLVGGRPQPISQAAVYSFALPGNAPGAVDLNTGLYRPGIGNTQNGFGFPAFSWTTFPTEIDLAWSAPLTRGTMPLPSQSDNVLDQATLTGSINCTGLANSTLYRFFGYVDDKNRAAGIQWVNNSQVAGAVGTPAIAYTTASMNAAAFQQRNDHLPVTIPPLNISTLASGGGSGGSSGGGAQGVCPRGDMVVKRKTDTGFEIIRCAQLRVNDWIWGHEQGIDCWVRIRWISKKLRQHWAELAFDCREDIVVTPNHAWPTDRGIVPSSQLTPEHVFYLDDRGRTFLDGWRKLQGEAVCVGIDLDSTEHAYYIGRHVPRVRTQNFIQAS